MLAALVFVIFIAKSQCEVFDENMGFVFFALVFSLDLWTISTTPAKANVLCFVRCVNAYTNCVTSVRAACINEGPMCVAFGEQICSDSQPWVCGQ